MRFLVGGLGVALLLGAACGDAKVCAPGDQESCPCAGGASGFQVCSDDGSRFGACSGCAEGVDLGAPFDAAAGDEAAPPVDAAPADTASVADLSSTPDLAVPDLVMPDLAMADLAVPRDFAGCILTNCQAAGFACGSHPNGCGGTLSCGGCTLPSTCGGSGVDGQCGGCSKYGLVGAPPSGAPGGQRIFDSKGYLYFTSFKSLARVPPGGGTAQVLAAAATVGTMGWVGAPYVEANDTVLFQATGKVLRYDPSTQQLSTFASPGGADAYAAGVLEDASGNVIALRKDLVFDKSANLLAGLAFLGDWAVVTPTWIYRVGPQRTYLAQDCFDGTSESLLANNQITDAYGLAVAPDGSLYVGQGNHDPATIYKIVGGSATPLTTVPMSVFGVAMDPSGASVYAAGSDGNTLWKIDTQSGAKVVYGCDPASTHKCGDTM